MPGSPGRVSGLTVAMKMCPKMSGVATAAIDTCRIHDANAIPGIQIRIPVTM